MDIPCFALLDIHSPEESRRNFIVVQDPGMRITVDLKQMTPSDRSKTIDDLLGLIDLLRKTS